jgi:hypothetical protein
MRGLSDAARSVPLVFSHDRSHNLLLSAELWRAGRNPIKPRAHNINFTHHIQALLSILPPPSFANMTDSAYILITAGPYQFLAKFEADAPKTVNVFRGLLPYHKQLIHVRWSGEGLWVPLGDEDLGVTFENHTTHPSTGQILLYPGGFSETELLFCYGGVSFASKMGPLAANHFLTIVEGTENLRALGELVLWKGAQDVLFETANSER